MVLCVIIVFGCVMLQVDYAAATLTHSLAAVATLFTHLKNVAVCTARGKM